MSLLSCLRCATKFAVGLLACPQCLSEDFEEADVPKNTTWGGASYPQPLEEEGAAAEAAAEVEAPAVEAEPVPEAAVEAAPEPEPEPAAPAEKPAPSLSKTTG